MSFFKDFKDDLSQAVNELAGEEEKEVDDKALEAELNDIVNTLDDSEVIANEEAVVEEAVEEAPAVSPVAQAEPTPAPAPAHAHAHAPAPAHVAAPVEEELPEATDEVAEITKGMSVEGNISATGSINLNGKVKGDVASNGKLSINGEIIGNSSAREVFTNNARVMGDIKSNGSVKIGNGTVIVGNVYGTSAVIAGAVRGEIDIKGPVIVDATAVVQGDIKSKSVQINNGAVIDGHCSQCYADVDFTALFEDTFA